MSRPVRTLAGTAFASRVAVHVVRRVLAVVLAAVALEMLLRAWGIGRGL